jgi:hypothetical protein
MNPRESKEGKRKDESKEEGDGRRGRERCTVSESSRRGAFCICLYTVSIQL